MRKERARLGLRIHIPNPCCKWACFIQHTLVINACFTDRKITLLIPVHSLGKQYQVFIVDGVSLQQHLLFIIINHHCRFCHCLCRFVLTISTKIKQLPWYCIISGFYCKYWINSLLAYRYGFNYSEAICVLLLCLTDACISHDHILVFFHHVFFSSSTLTPVAMIVRSGWNCDIVFPPFRSN